MPFQYGLGDCILADDETEFLTERGLKVMYHKEKVIVQNRYGRDLTKGQKRAILEVCENYTPFEEER